MIYKLKIAAKKKWFDFRCKTVFSTPPLTIKPTNVAIVSMLCHADLVMYLVSIKSFYSRLGHGKIFILNDGSLDEKDKAALNHHLGFPIIIPISSVSTGPCPKGGCWERIFLVSQLSEEYYVIQLDADIVTPGPVPEIQAAIESQSSFTLGTPQGLKFVNLIEASKFVKNTTGNHIQTLSEKYFHKLPNSSTRRYVRGCAGLTGFAKNTLPRSTIEAFSTEMESSLGVVWKNWGSEQVTSNYLVANTPSAFVLPFPKYSSYEPGVDTSKSSLIHFFGTYRFSNNIYIKRSREFLKNLVSKS